MHDILPPFPMFAGFLAASFVLAVTPGPGVFYILARSIAHGRGAGLASVAGVAAGNACNALGASLGLAVLFAVSSAAFAAIKWAGAAYLIYLGIRALAAAGSPSQLHGLSAVPTSRVFRDGFVVALLNPKTAIFFAAFLPQFMSASAPPGQAVVLGWVFVATAAVTDAVYALAAGHAPRTLTRSRMAGLCGRIVSGSALLGLGVYVALTGARR
jgi:threonine/homoserine/homoserine lactone efflux protein